MIFQPTFVELVLAGRKTQTRRPVRWPSNPAEWAEPVPCRYLPGRDYAIQPGRGTAAVGRLLVEEVTRVRVESISHLDATAEGFASPAAFLTWWQARYGTTAGLCWRIRFKLLTQEA